MSWKESWGKTTKIESNNRFFYDVIYCYLPRIKELASDEILQSVSDREKNIIINALKYIYTAQGNIEVINEENFKEYLIYLKEEFYKTKYEAILMGVDNEINLLKKINYYVNEIVSILEAYKSNLHLSPKNVESPESEGR